MKKKQFLRFLALLLVMAFGISTAWAGEQTINSISTKNVTSDEIATVNQDFGVINVAFERKSGNPAGFYTSSGILRFYKNDIMTISCASYNITKIQFTMNSGNPGTALPEGLTGTTWEGSAKTIKFTCTENSAKINSLVITYGSNNTVAYTVSFDAGTGTYTGTSLTETSANAGITLPAASISAASGWVFEGWAEETCTSTTNAPTLYKVSSTYYPKNNCTLYAVYSKSEGESNDYGVTTDLTPGKYVLGAVKAAASPSLANNTTIGAITFSSMESWGSFTGITPSTDGVISNPDAAAVWTLSGNNTDGYVLKKGDLYLYLKTSTGASTAGTDAQEKTIFVTDESTTCKDAFLLHPSSSSTNKLLLNAGSSSYGYRMYVSGTNASATMCPYIRFYKCNGVNTYDSNPSFTNVAVEGVTLSPTPLTLTVGETGTLTATVSPANASDKNVTWSSSDNEVATVSNTGVVTAVKKGTATITVTSAENNDYTATCVVTVNMTVTYNANNGTEDAAITATFDPDDDVIVADNTFTKTGFSFKNWNTAADGSGTTYDVGATTLPINANTTLYAQWTKDAYTVTLVPGAGTVTNTQLVETTGVAGVTLPTPTFNVYGWSFAGWSETSCDEETTNAPATLIPAGAYTPEGNITLYAVYKKTVAGSAGFSLVTKASDLEVGATYTISSTATAYEGMVLGTQQDKNIKGVDWATTNSPMTFVLGGSANAWTMKVVGGNYLYAPSATGSSKDNHLKQQATPDEAKAYWTINPTEGATEIKVTGGTNRYILRSNGDIFSCYGSDQSDVFLFKFDAGTTYYNSNPQTIAVTSISLNKTETSLTVGETETLTVTFDPNDASNQNVTWSSSAPTIASVENGVVIALAAGNAVITATSQSDDTKYASCEVTVTLPTYTLTYNANNGTDNTSVISYTSGDEVIVAGKPEDFTKDGFSFKNWKVDGSDQTYNVGDKFNITANTALLAQWVATVTLDAGAGTCDTESLTETSMGAGVTLPTATCNIEGWSFAGWATEACNGETTTRPTLIPAGAYTPTEYFDLFAVYYKNEGGETGFQLVTSDSDLIEGDVYTISNTATAYEGMVLGEMNSTGNNIKAADWSATESPMTFVLGGSTNAWTMYVEGEGYLYAPNAQGSLDKNYLKIQNNLVDGQSYWTITPSSSTTLIRVTGGANRYDLRYNKAQNNQMFSCYQKDTQEPVFLFRYSEGTYTYSSNPQPEKLDPQLRFDAPVYYISVNDEEGIELTHTTVSNADKSTFEFTPSDNKVAVNYVDGKHILTVNNNGAHATGESTTVTVTIPATETHKEAKTEFDVKVVPETFTLDAKADELRTFSCDHALDFSSAPGVTAYVVCEDGDDYVLLKKVTGVIPANTGLMLKAEPDRTFTIETSTEPGVAPEVNYLRPALEGSKILPTEEGVVERFVYGKITGENEKKFHRLINNFMISQGNYAYLELPVQQTLQGQISLKSRRVLINDATDIDDVIILRNDGVMYNVWGVPVGEDYRGIVIKNGRKILKKD